MRGKWRLMCISEFFNMKTLLHLVLVQKLISNKCVLFKNNLLPSDTVPLIQLCLTFPWLCKWRPNFQDFPKFPRQNFSPLTSGNYRLEIIFFKYIFHIFRSANNLFWKFVSKNHIFLEKITPGHLVQCRQDYTTPTCKQEGAKTYGSRTDTHSPTANSANNPNLLMKLSNDYYTLFNKRVNRSDSNASIWKMCQTMTRLPQLVD